MKYNNMFLYCHHSVPHACSSLLEVQLPEVKSQISSEFITRPVTSHKFSVSILSMVSLMNFSSISGILLANPMHLIADIISYSSSCLNHLVINV